MMMKMSQLVVRKIRYKYNAFYKQMTLKQRQIHNNYSQKIVRIIHGKTLRDRIYSEELEWVEWVNVRRLVMWKESLTTVSRRSFCITVQRGTETEEGQRKDGRRAGYDPEG